MKTSIMKTAGIIAFLTLFVLSTANATIRYVDGNGGQTNYYATISAAITAASAGDTVLVGPGKYNENNAQITVDKKVILIGSGYRELKNGGTHLMGGFNLSSSASGSKIMAFRFINQAYVTLAASCNNVIIANNYFTAIESSGIYALNISGGQNDTVRNNLFYHSGIYVTGNNHNINNNIIIRGFYTQGSYTSYFYGINSGAVVNLLIYNNIIGEVSGANVNYSIVVGTPLETKIVSNIFYSCTHVTDINAVQTALYSYNHKWGTAGSEPIVDYSNSTGDPTFQIFNSAFSYSDNPATDTDFHLLEGSPAIDAGYDNTSFLGAGYVYGDNEFHGGKGTGRSDCGIYGGPFPFPNPVGWPILPAIKSLSIDKSIVQPGGSVNINAEGLIQSYPGRGN